jgi:hypothetical protein
MTFLPRRFKISNKITYADFKVTDIQQQQNAHGLKFLPKMIVSRSAYCHFVKKSVLSLAKII